jgi:hypothetical protein
LRPSWIYLVGGRPVRGGEGGGGGGAPLSKSFDLSFDDWPSPVSAGLAPRAAPNAVPDYYRDQ